MLKDHEKITPYSCEHCNQSFGLESSLKTHITNVHQRVKCDECNQVICNKFMLKRHKAKVHGIKPASSYQCDYCPLVYDTKICLDKHIAKNHSNNDNKPPLIKHFPI